MGSAIARALLAHGHSTTVWNRTAEKANSLLTEGAVLAPNVAAAIEASNIVVLCLMNHEAVLETLAEVEAEWGARILVNLSSGTPSEAREMEQFCNVRSINYLDGAILTPTEAIDTPTAAVLYCGTQSTYDRAKHALSAIGGAQHYLGDDIGRANAYDVALLDLFATCMYGLTHAFALASSEGIQPSQLTPYAKGLSQILPGIIDNFANDIEVGAFPGARYAIKSARSAISHIITATREHNLDVQVLGAIQEVMSKAVANGFGDEGLARLTTVHAS